MANIFEKAALGGFQQGVSLGSQGFQSQMERNRRKREFDAQMKAQQQAERFRQSMAGRKLDLQEQRAGDESELLKLRMQKLQQEMELAPAMQQARLQQAASGERRAEEMHKSKLALNREMRRGKAQQRKAAEASARESQKLWQQLGGQKPKFSMADLAERPAQIFQAVDQAAMKYQAKFGRKMPDSTYNKLRDDAAKAAHQAQTENMIRRKFQEIAEKTGMDVDGLSTMLGSTAGLGRFFPKLKENAQAFEMMEGWLVQLSTTLQQSEPNSKLKQDMAMQLTEISKLDTDSQLKARAEFIIDILRTRQKEVGMYLRGEGILKPTSEPKTRKLKGPQLGSFNIPGE